jgi:hypothetical protein
MEGPRMYIKSSTWMVKGWTYQEVLLSTRRLIFTDHQVCYECYGMYYCEARFSPQDLLVKNHQGQPLKEPYRDEKFNGMFLTKGVGSGRWVIMLCIKQYTKRSFISHSGALKALYTAYRKLSAFQSYYYRTETCSQSPGDIYSREA